MVVEVPGHQHVAVHTPCGSPAGEGEGGGGGEREREGEREERLREEERK